MELNQVCFDDGCFMENFPDVKRHNFVSDEGSKYIVDLLPNDPFGMELNISLPTDPFVIGFEISLPKDPFGMDFEIGTGWIEDFGLRGYELDSDEDKVVAGLTFYWASSLMYEHDHDDGDIGVGGLKTDNPDGEYLTHEKNENSDADGGEPADAFLFAISYLGVKDLLTLERVCKSLFDAVQDETLVWKNITIDYPLSDKITDDGLLQLTNRAKGTLCSLSLLKCLKITNTGLKQCWKEIPD